jgi:hypothetical protein
MPNAYIALTFGLLTSVSSPWIGVTFGTATVFHDFGPQYDPRDRLACYYYRSDLGRVRTVTTLEDLHNGRHALIRYAVRIYGRSSGCRLTDFSNPYRIGYAMTACSVVTYSYSWSRPTMTKLGTTDRWVLGHIAVAVWLAVLAAVGLTDPDLAPVSLFTPELALVAAAFVAFVALFRRSHASLSYLGLAADAALLWFATFTLLSVFRSPVFDELEGAQRATAVVVLGAGIVITGVASALAIRDTSATRRS